MRPYPETCAGMLEYADGTFRCVALSIRRGETRGECQTDDEATALCRECGAARRAQETVQKAAPDA